MAAESDLERGVAARTGLHSSIASSPSAGMTAQPKVIEGEVPDTSPTISVATNAGMAFIYKKLLELLAVRDRITRARWVYFLTRIA